MSDETKPVEGEDEESTEQEQEQEQEQAVRVGMVTTNVGTGPGVMYPVTRKQETKVENPTYGEGDDDDRPSLHLRTADGTSVRRLLPQGRYLDLEFGLGVVHPSNPDYEEIRQWAESTPWIEVIGHKQGTVVCQVCGDAVEGGEVALAEHVNELHVYNEEQETTGQPPSAADLAAASKRRQRRAQRAASSIA